MSILGCLGSISGVGVIMDVMLFLFLILVLIGVDDGGDVYGCYILRMFVVVVSMSVMLMFVVCSWWWEMEVGMV